MDQVDHSIVECLLGDGRATYAQVGKVVGLSVAATKRRIDRLVRTQVIRGFTAVVDSRVLGWNLEAHVSLYTTGTVPYATVRRDLEAVPEVVEAFTVTGAPDTRVHVVAGDAVHLEKVIGRLRTLPYVQQTDTTLLLSRLLQRSHARPT